MATCADIYWVRPLVSELGFRLFGSFVSKKKLPVCFVQSNRHHTAGRFQYCSKTFLKVVERADKVLFVRNICLSSSDASVATIVRPRQV